MGWVKKVIGFVVFSTLLYMVSIVLLSRVSIGTYPLIYGLSDGLNLKGGNTYQKFVEYDPSEYQDVVILGSSHAYRGYDPRIFEKYGYRAFNLGTSSQTPYNSYFIVEGLLRPQNTGLLILDVFLVASEMEPLESSSDLIQNVKDDGIACEMMLGMKDPRALNMFTLRMLTKDVEPFFMDTSYVGQGYSVNDAEAPIRIDYRQDGTLELNPIQAEYLEMILENCKEAGIPVVMVDHPVPVEVRGRRHGEMTALLEDFSNKHQIAFLDFSFAEGFDSREHFFDHTHLNQAGVEKFNLLLIEELEHRNLIQSSNGP